MVTRKRIIPCLDVDQGRVVKGQRFKDLQDVADPITLAKKYSEAGADELVFLDISASLEERTVFLDLIAEIAKEIAIPFTVGGGIGSLEDMEKVFAAGVDKISINSAAIKNPLIIQKAAKKFGSSRIVLSVDVKTIATDEWSVYERGGRTETGMDALKWIQQGERLGAGEVVVNSIDSDGVKDGFNLPLVQAVVEAVDIPVVASGGAGTMEHFLTILTEGKAEGALAASVFHYDEIDIAALKQYLQKNSSNEE